MATMTAAYERGWNQLTTAHYSQSEWPSEELIAPLVNDGASSLPSDAWLRARCVLTPALLAPSQTKSSSSSTASSRTGTSTPASGPTSTTASSRTRCVRGPALSQRQREAAFCADAASPPARLLQTSCELFNLLLNSDGPVDLELPSQWLWDLLDEFIWQFQSFGQYRSDWKTKAEEEMALLAEGNQVWSCYSVLNVLYSLIQKSRINEQLEAEQAGKSTEEIACVPSLRLLPAGPDCGAQSAVEP